MRDVIRDARRRRLPNRPGPSDGPRLSSWSRGGGGSLPVTIVPWSLLQTRRRVADRAQAHDRFASIALAIILGVLFAVNLSVTVITVVVPTIADEFSTSDGTVVWAVTGPILVAAVLGPSFGKIGDQRGHRSVLLAGLVVNAAFTLAIAASASAGQFVGFRLLAAVGGAGIGPASLAYINRLFPPEDRAAALGWWSFVGAGAPVFGVVAGGFLIDLVGWRWVFVVQAPVVLAAALIVAFVLPDTEPAPPSRFDWIGASTLAAGVGSLLLVVTRAGENGVDALGVAAVIVAVVLLTWFWRHEQRHDAPLLPPAYWRLPGFVLPTAVLALSFGAYMGSFVLAPLMLQGPFGLTARATSLVIIVRPSVFSIAGPLFGRLASRVGEVALVRAGSWCMVASMAVLAVAEPGRSVIWVALGLGLAGLGMGAAAPSATALVASSVEETDLGVAGAAQQMVQQVGLVVGIQVMQAVQAATDSPAGGDIVSYRWAFVVGIGFALAGAVMAITLTRAAGRSSLSSLTRAGS